MSIKINELSNSQPQRSGEGNRLQDAAARGQNPVAKENADQTSKAGDRVTLTQTAQQMKDVEAAVRREPVVNAERVATLKTAIANGEYSIDAGRIAEKLMRIEDDL